MVSPTVKLNNRPGLGAMQVTPSHTLVPVESLTNSPTSSTGSASVLEWNSNSDGELLQLSSPSSLTTPLSPPPPPLSPSIVFALPTADATRDDSPQAVDSGMFSSAESSTPGVWTPLFDDLGSPAPMFARDNTIVVDDGSTTGHDAIRPSQDPEVDKLRDLFDHSFWRAPLLDMGIPPLPDESRSPTPFNNIHNARNPFFSMTSTIVPPQLRSSSSGGPMATTTGPRPTVPYEIPPLSSGFFQSTCSLSPNMSPEVSQKPTPPPLEEESISIAEYFQRKARSSEELELRSPEFRSPEPPLRTPRSEVEAIQEVPTPRPASSNSALSYVTEPNSPVSPIPPIHSPIRHSISPCPSSPSVHTVEDQQNMNNDETLLSFSRSVELPVPMDRRNPSNRSFWPSSPATFGPFSSPGVRSEVELDASSIIGERDPPREPASFSPYSLRSCSPRPPVIIINPRLNEPEKKKDRPIRRTQYPVPSHLPRRNVGGSARASRFPSLPREMMTPDPSVLNISSLLNSTRISEPEERKPPVTVNVPQPLPRSTFSSSPISEQDNSYPNIPTWLVNAARGSLPSISARGNANASTTSRLRPLPLAPKIEGTPQLALRSDLDKPPQFSESAYFAQPEPSNWSTRNAVSPPPPFSPVTARNGNRYSYPASDTTMNSPVSVRVDPLPPVPPPPPVVHPMVPNASSWATTPRGLSNAFYPSPPSPLPPPQAPLQSLQPPFYRSPPSGSYCQPTYTDSTLPRDRGLPPPSSPNWDPHYPTHPTQQTQSARRLRFAPPSSASATRSASFKLGPSTSSVPPLSAPPFIPPYASLGPTFFNGNNGYIYQTPAPVIPQFPTTPTSNPTANVPLNTFSNQGYPSNRRYWFADATVIFRVEDCLYRVHRHFFDKHSDYISRMLTSYSLYDLSSHVFLPDVKKVEFERLLSIFYPTDLTKSDITTVAGWTSTLSLSQKWQMPQVTALAIQKLTPLTSAVEKLSIARRHNFLPNHEWILPAYIELCSRLTPLTYEEAEELDLATVVKIWEVQHAVHALTYRHGTWSDVRIVDMVKAKFGYTVETGYPTSWDI